MQLPFVVVGSPENRRVVLFQRALAASGSGPARVVSWSDIIATRGEALARIPEREALLRIDSFGEDAEVEGALLELGYEAAKSSGALAIEPARARAMLRDRGRIVAPRQHHLGLLQALDAIDGVLDARPGLRPLSPTRAIRDLFDKRVTSRAYASLGIPVPRAFFGDTSAGELREAMADAGIPEVYVKLSCASSASCLAVFRRGRGESLRTTMGMDARGYFNSLNVCTYTNASRIDAVLAWLLREGAHVEEGIPKARMGRAFFDCRVLVVANEPAFTPAFTVVRTSPHPITNLHLGGARGDVARFEALVPEAVRSSMMESARAIGRHHGCLHVGVDAMIDARLRGHYVLEANAFGDLLPGLMRDGLDVYGFEIRAARSLYA